MLTDVKQIKQYIKDTNRNIHTSIPGKIKSYDASKGTAEIQPSGKYKKSDGTYIDYPTIKNVPVTQIQSSSQNCSICLPIKEGDGCMINFSEQQLDYFRDEQEPKTDLRFDLTNAVATVGLCKDANDVSKDACDNDAIIFQNKRDSKVTIKEDNVEIKMKNSTITIDKNGNITIKSEQKVKIEAPSGVDITGNVAVTGNITVTGDVSVPTASLGTHVHVVSTAPGISTPGLSAEAAAKALEEAVK